MHSPKYTFLLPAYKSKFIAEALESIKRQTYTNFKCLVSDDCSPEDLRSIFDSVVGDDPRFSFRRNEVNMGSKSLVSHWNLLVDMCETDYFIMASDDDVYEPNFLMQIDDLVGKYPNVDLLRARAQRIDENKTTLIDDDIPEILSQNDFMQYFGVKPMILCLANYVFRTSALRAMGAFPDFPTAAKSDSATALYLSKNGVATTKDVLFSFRMSTSNLSSANGYSKNTEQTLIANLMFADWYKRIFGVRYPYSTFVEGVVFYLLARVSFANCIKYYYLFLKRGYFRKTKSIFTILKNWIILHK